MLLSNQGLPNCHRECHRTSNVSDLTQTIKNIDRVTQLGDHALFRGKIYTRPDQANMTFVMMMEVNSYLHHLLSNDNLHKKVLKHFATLSCILVHEDCTIFRQLVFDNDLIEVLNGFVFKISARRFISCPLGRDAYWKTCLRSIVPYDSSAIPNAGSSRSELRTPFQIWNSAFVS